MNETSLAKMLDALDWKKIELTSAAKRESGLPVVVSQGVIKLGPLEIRVYQLSNGQRVLDAKDVHEFFAELEK